MQGLSSSLGNGLGFLRSRPQVSSGERTDSPYTTPSNRNIYAKNSYNRSKNKFEKDLVEQNSLQKNRSATTMHRIFERKEIIYDTDLPSGKLNTKSGGINDLRHRGNLPGSSKRRPGYSVESFTPITASETNINYRELTPKNRMYVSDMENGVKAIQDVSYAKPLNLIEGGVVDINATRAPNVQKKTVYATKNPGFSSALAKGSDLGALSGLRLRRKLVEDRRGEDKWGAKGSGDYLPHKQPKEEFSVIKDLEFVLNKGLPRGNLESYNDSGFGGSYKKHGPDTVTNTYSENIGVRGFEREADRDNIIQSLEQLLGEDDTKAEFYVGNVSQRDRGESTHLGMNTTPGKKSIKKYEYTGNITSENSKTFEVGQYTNVNSKVNPVNYTNTGGYSDSTGYIRGDPLNGLHVPESSTIDDYILTQKAGHIQGIDIKSLGKVSTQDDETSLQRKGYQYIPGHSTTYNNTFNDKSNKKPNKDVLEQKNNRNDLDILASAFADPIKRMPDGAFKVDY